MGHTLESVIGKSRTDRLRAAEAALRGETPPAAPKSSVEKAPVKAVTKAGVPITSEDHTGYGPSDPYVDFPAPSMSRHELLGALHAQFAPRTYLEIGIDKGLSLAQSRSKSIGIDPAFEIRAEIACEVQLVKETSDDYFASPDVLSFFGGLPIDLAFIDGMHLSEYVLRDFINVEKHMSPAGIVVLDDMLPRNILEAARDRRTAAWTGDVYKVATILTEHRPDLTVIPVNTSPTGTVVVLGLDPTSRILEERLDELLPGCLSPDPQDVPVEWMSRSSAVDPAALLASPAWARLAAQRDGSGDLTPILAELAAIPPTSPTAR